MILEDAGLESLYDEFMNTNHSQTSWKNGAKNIWAI